MLRLFDTAVGRIVPIEPRVPGSFSFYACGPTVYDLPHLGHGRAVLTWDLLRRHLEWSGLEVRHVANITDIDDKIIERAAQQGRSAETVAAQYEDEWWKAMDRLGVLRPHEQPHATGWVEQMVALIERLIAAGVAYDTDATVWFSPSSVSDYGLLARQTIASLQAGARVEADPDKRSPVDFALWKKANGPDDVPQWPSPWGAGRPGWHTECVVMSLGLLGDGFDLHGGGLDLMFPHHENERAQAMADGHAFARHWVHHGFVEMAGEKMSKSLGNFTSLTDLLDRHDPRAFRLLLARAHYRSPVEVTPELVAEAESALARVDALARRVLAAGGALPDDAASLVGRAAAAAGTVSTDPGLVTAFAECLDDDLDTPGAIAAVFEALRAANAAFDSDDAAGGLGLGGAVLECLGALGLFAKSGDDVPAEVLEEVRRLDAARADKDWATADALRASLAERGWRVEQQKGGSSVRRA